MKVVLDTNILISAILSEGAPYAVLKRTFDQAFTLVTSVDLIAELRQKLTGKLHFGTEDVDSYVNFIEKIGTIVEPHMLEKTPLTDPKDAKVLECAVGAKAEYIVSGDHHLLELKEFQGIKIVTSKEFLAIID